LRGGDGAAPAGFAGLPTTAFDGHRLTTRVHQKAMADEMAALVASLGPYLGEPDDIPGRRVVGFINEEHGRILLIWQNGKRLEFDALSVGRPDAAGDR
jgi:hypothetical protein